MLNASNGHNENKMVEKDLNWLNFVGGRMVRGDKQGAPGMYGNVSKWLLNTECGWIHLIQMCIFFITAYLGGSFCFLKTKLFQARC